MFALRESVFFKSFSGFFPKGGGTFDDSDLFNVGEGDYKPEGGKMSAQSLCSNAEMSRPSWGNTHKINIYFRVAKEIAFSALNLKIL